MVNYKDKCVQVKYLSNLEYYHKIVEISGQKIISGIEHSSYKSNFDLQLVVSNKDRIHPRINYQPDQTIFFKIFFLDKEYYIYHIQIKDIIRYLDKNIKADKRFVCLPIKYTNCHIKKSHCGCIIFDTKNKEIIILEPNGQHPINFINKLFNIILIDICRYKPGYKFIPLNIWLTSGVSLNCWKDTDELGYGICATANLFLIHKLIELNDKSELDRYLSKLNEKMAINELKLFIDKYLNI